MSGVLAGSLGTSLSDPATYLAGASGGVYALIAAHLATMALNWQEDNQIRIKKVGRRENIVCVSFINISGCQEANHKDHPLVFHHHPHPP